MSEYLFKLKMDLELNGYSPKMVLTYVKWVKHFLNTFDFSPDELINEHICEYLHHAIIVKKLGRSYLNSNYRDLRFFFETILSCHWKIKPIQVIHFLLCLDQQK